LLTVDFETGYTFLVQKGELTAVVASHWSESILNQKRQSHSHLTKTVLSTT